MAEKEAEIKKCSYMNGKGEVCGLAIRGVGCDIAAHRYHDGYEICATTGCGNVRQKNSIGNTCTKCKQKAARAGKKPVVKPVEVQKPDDIDAEEQKLRDVCKTVLDLLNTPNTHVRESFKNQFFTFKLPLDVLLGRIVEVCPDMKETTDAIKEKSKPQTQTK